MIEEYNKNYRASYIIYAYYQLMKSKKFFDSEYNGEDLNLKMIE